MTHSGGWRKSSRSSNSGGNCVEVRWRKSSRSSPSGNNCVEVRWRKSTHSQPNSGNCVEVRMPDAVEVRDSKVPALGTLAMSRTDFTALLHDLKL